MKSVAILYGLAEGPRVSKRLTELLRKHDFSITTDVQNADVIIAHSGGVYFVPKKSKAKTVLLVGASMGFEGSLLLLQSRKIKIDFLYCLKTNHYHYWFYKSFWNAIYLLTKQQYNWAMHKHALVNKTLLPEILVPKVFVITYDDDPWSGNIKKTEMQKFPHYTYIRKVGVHDDLWINPEKYLEYLV